MWSSKKLGMGVGKRSLLITTGEGEGGLAYPLFGSWDLWMVPKIKLILNYGIFNPESIGGRVHFYPPCHLFLYWSQGWFWGTMTLLYVNKLSWLEMAPIRGVNNFMVKIYWTKKGLKMKNDIGLKVSNVQKRHNGIKCVKFLLPIKFNVFRETNFWAGLKSIGWWWSWAKKGLKQPYLPE